MEGPHQAYSGFRFRIKWRHKIFGHNKRLMKPNEISGQEVH